MAFLTKLINIYFGKRLGEIDRFRNNPVEVQEDQLSSILARSAGTEYSEEHLKGVKNYEDLRRTPVNDYETYTGLIQRCLNGEDNILWPSHIKWFAKSSGTTHSKSKFIPVTNDCLKESHLQGPRDVIAVFTDLYPDSKVFMGKTLTLGGSKKIVNEGSDIFSGDLSAILLENTPEWANFRRVPSVDTALIPDFEKKIEAIAKETIGENVSSFAGVPSWNLVMMNRILEISGKDNLLEIWPGLELFIHGGMNFGPYREQYNKIIPSDSMKYFETYNASEGFFALADQRDEDDMLLMLDYGIFYEFWPIGSMDDPSTIVPLEGVKTAENYAMLISSSNGLWRYMIGDTVKFTSTSPYRIRITGRTKHYINAFGEELIIENAENAIQYACEQCQSVVSEYTAAPVYMKDKSKGAHEWIIEFETPPQSLENFRDSLDAKLQELNSDYEAKRFRNVTLDPPVIKAVPTGTFLKWMERRGKLGGQNKVPRLFNDRTYAEELLSLHEI